MADQVCPECGWESPAPLVVTLADHICADGSEWDTQSRGAAVRAAMDFMEWAMANGRQLRLAREQLHWATAERRVHPSPMERAMAEGSYPHAT